MWCWCCCSSPQAAGIPFLIFSAGLADVIQEVLTQVQGTGDAPVKQTRPGQRIVSNRMLWSGGILTGFSEPLIHMFNKNQSQVCT